MMVGDNVQNQSVVNSDLQFDMKSKQDAVGDGPARQELEQDRKAARQILKQIEEATGLGDMNAVIDKAEKHADSFSTLNELHKTLQTKMLNLYQKKD